MHSAELVSRLTRELGLGDNPIARLRLYGRLASAAEKSDLVLAVVRAVQLESRLKKCPGKWFAAAVGRRLLECGLMEQGRGVSDIVGGVAGSTQMGGG